MLYIITLIEL